MAYEHSQRGLRLRRYYFMFIFIFRPPGSPMNENSGTDRGEIISLLGQLSLRVRPCESAVLTLPACSSCIFFPFHFD